MSRQADRAAAERASDYRLVLAEKGEGKPPPAAVLADRAILTGTTISPQDARQAGVAVCSVALKAGRGTEAARRVLEALGIAGEAS